ncbi:hypothetical protein BDW69DRAFT_110442 [Aspergillus filifer]
MLQPDDAIACRSTIPSSMMSPLPAHHRDRRSRAPVPQPWKPATRKPGNTGLEGLGYS